MSINIHNSKGTWKLIKNIINKSNDNKNNYVCKNNDSIFSIANKCNDIFSNLGNNVSKLIINPNINTSMYDTLEDKDKMICYILGHYLSYHKSLNILKTLLNLV